MNEPEERRGEEVAAPARDRGSQEAADDAAGQHERNRARLVGGRRDFRGREPVLQADGVVDADDRRREAVQRKAAQPQRRHRQAAAADVDERARHEARAGGPTRAIHSDIGIVVSADPSTYVVAPSVAMVFVSTSE